MSLPPDARAAAPRGTPRFVNSILVWNRRLHYYLGLYLLFFCWLFTLSGLLLNHPRWEFAQFWPRRIERITEHAIVPPRGASNVERARDLMTQLSLAGEIQWPAVPPAAGRLAFQVSRPGLTTDVDADGAAGRATVHSTALNAWGVFHVLHTFTGMAATESRHERDWALTTVWAFTMDAVAGGLILMVLSSYIMWFQLRPKRAGGILALMAGFAACAAFVLGFRWPM
jgi:hypothetical protein